MNMQSRIPSPEAARSAGDMIDQMRLDLIAAQTRAAELEDSIREMEAEHRAAFEDMRSAHETENDELRYQMNMANKLNATLTLDVEILRKNADDDLRIQERLATILSVVSLAVNKANDEMLTLVGDKAVRTASIVPDSEEFEPKEAPGDPETMVRKLSPDARRTMLGRLADELTKPQDDGEPVPAFLKVRPGVELG